MSPEKEPTHVAVACQPRGVGSVSLNKGFK